MLQEKTTLLVFAPMFSESGDVRFLTFRGPDSKHQKIQFVQNLIKKHCSTYVIVREKNKRTEGFHFHAIGTFRSEPKKTWYKKGCHMHLQKVGSAKAFRSEPDGTCVKTEAQASAALVTRPTLEELDTETPDQKFERVIDKVSETELKKLKFQQQYFRVLAYMSKELELPCQYTDYICVRANKNISLEDAPKR